jgi:hypothetical protein
MGRTNVSVNRISEIGGEADGPLPNGRQAAEIWAAG